MRRHRWIEEEEAEEVKPCGWGLFPLVSVESRLRYAWDKSSNRDVHKEPEKGSLYAQGKRLARLNQKREQVGWKKGMVIDRGWLSDDPAMRVRPRWWTKGGHPACSRPPISRVKAEGAVARRASCRQRCSRRRRRARTRCRRRRRSRTRTAPGVAARSFAGPPPPTSGQPPPRPGERRSWDWDKEGRPVDRSAATPPDQTPRSLWAERGREDTMSARFLYGGTDNCYTLMSGKKQALVWGRGIKSFIWVATTIKGKGDFFLRRDSSYSKRPKRLTVTLDNRYLFFSGSRNHDEVAHSLTS